MATLVFFHAHPDDEAIATAGTMFKAAKAGHRVVLVVATDGELGEVQPGILAEGETLGQRRKAEVHAAAQILGIHRSVFLGYHDSGMAGEPSNDDPACFWQADVDAAADQLLQILLEEKPAALTVYDPHGGYGHPDHIQVHRVGTAAAAKAGISKVYWATMNRDQIRRQMAPRLAAAELLEEERREMARAEDFGMPEAEISHAIDVSDVLDIKRAALKAHASQIDPESFFLSMEDDSFKEAFGTEWYVAAYLRDAKSKAAPRGGQFYDDLLVP